MLTKLFQIGLFATLLISPLHSAHAASAPNIVVFLTDDHSQNDSSPYGNAVLHTPNIQRLSDAGLTFDEAYVASPSCAPSRASLLTGLMPARNGAEANHAKPLPDIKKWPAYFQDLGYEVVAYGKVSHYKHTIDYGFDSFAHDTFHDHAAMPAAAEYLNKRKNDGDSTRPLCIMVGTNWPHVPWPTDRGDNDPAKLLLPTASVETTVTRHDRALYAAAVEKADNDLGLIYDTARKTLGDDTVFLFSSDHGTQWPFAKWNCYEAGVKIPLIIVWPGTTKPGTRTSAMVSWIDFLPTLLEGAGGTPPANIDGQSFYNVLSGKTRLHRIEMFTTHSGDGNWNIYPIRALRQGNWKYILNLHPEYAFTTHIDLAGELGRTKYWDSWEKAAQTSPTAAAIVTRYHKRPAEELYNLATDPGEQTNVASKPENQQQLKAMRQEVQTWMKDQGDQKKVYGTPRLLTDPKAYGPNALPMK